MKDTWYADNRDVCKWGGIVYLCKQEAINLVIQVAYYQKDKQPKLELDGRELDFPDEVLEHFRNIDRIQNLAQRTGISIEVINDEFTHNTRIDYHVRLRRKLGMLKEHKLVLLDPDNGLAPTKPGPEHVIESDIRLVWDNLLENDILVLYQHRFRNKDWKSKRRDQFACACGVVPDHVHEWTSEKAKDVVLFYLKKA